MQPCKILLTGLSQGQHLFIYLFSVGQGRYNWFIFIIMLKGGEAEFAHWVMFFMMILQGQLSWYVICTNHYWIMDIPGHVTTYTYMYAGYILYIVNS